jgi:hypothetical protein
MSVVVQIHGALEGRVCAGYGARVNAGAKFDKLPGAGDDGFNRPTVTPVPAPPDDQLIRLAKVGTVLGGIVTLAIARWLRKHVEIRWRS